VPDERKLATILFADLTGSTAPADADDPERTRARLERFYDAMAAEIEAAGEPFALRALGIVRADEQLLDEAADRFRDLGLGWHSDQTETLRGLRKLALG
jgi:hypothetical protein